MRCLVALILVAGCTMDNPAFELETSGGTRGTDTGTSGSSGDTTSDTTTKGTSSTSTTADATTDPTTGPATTDGTGGMTTGVGSTSAGSTGGVVACPAEFHEEGPVLVEHLDGGGAIQHCGETLVFTGPVSANSGAWSMTECGNAANKCDCAGDVNKLLFTVPETWPWTLPHAPPCARVTVSWNAQCEFDEAVIFEMTPNGIGTVPWWVANAVGPAPALPQASVTPVLSEGCDCEQEGCCAMQPGTYKLKFDGFSWANGPYLYPGEETDATLNGPNATVTLANAASHQEPVCGVPPKLSWIVKRVP